MTMFGRHKKDESTVEGQELHVLNILDGSGHTEVKFDPNDPVAVQEVRDQFDALMASQRPLAYTMEGGEQGQIIKEFDPTAKETFITPQIQGG